MIKSPLAAEVVHPYLTGDNLLRHGGPTRYVVDLNECDKSHGRHEARPRVRSR